MWLKPIPTAGAEHVPQRHADTATHDSNSNLHYPPMPQKMTAPTYQLQYGTSYIKYQRDATFSVYLVFYNSTCFGRSLHPSSGVIYKL